jgi:hypothetical protein
VSELLLLMQQHAGLDLSGGGGTLLRRFSAHTHTHTHTPLTAWLSSTITGALENVFFCVQHAGLNASLYCCFTHSSCIRAYVKPKHAYEPVGTHAHEHTHTHTHTHAHTHTELKNGLTLTQVLPRLAARHASTWGSRQ